MRQLLVLLLWVALPRIGQAQPDRKFEPRYDALYQTARTNWLASPTNVVRAWEFARSTFDKAEFASNHTQRAQLAVEGIDAARKALILDEKCVGVHYYLAMNLGQVARTQLLGALRLVGEMETHFKIAAKLDASFDYGGADRNLGILYREAPGWPASIGNRSLSRVHLRKSVELAPTYPANQLELLLSYLDWKELSDAKEMSPKLEKLLKTARTEFVGPLWEWSWADWDRMWRDASERLAKAAK